MPSGLPNCRTLPSSLRHVTVPTLRGFFSSPFYVYQLVDPRSGLPFYIGKGKGDRFTAHEREARKGVSSPKCEKIKEIWAVGLQVEHEILERFETAKEAFEFESLMIEKIGRSNLTNFGRVAYTAEQKHRVFSSAFAKWLAVWRGDPGMRAPDPKVRPWGAALFRALQRRDPMPLLRTWIEKYGLEEMREALKPHGVILNF